MLHKCKADLIYLTYFAGIKTGRYTYEKRTKDILEVQQIKRDQSAANRQSAMLDRMAQANEVLAEIKMVSEKHRNILDYEPQRAALIKYMVRMPNDRSKIIVLVPKESRHHLR